MPIYNAMEYLDKSISSALNQSYSNFELILIDDGSTDNSFDICTKIAEKDSRIQVIRIQNSGPANARNIGISASKGEFIYFLDADDFLEQSTLLTLINSYNIYQTDLIISDFVKLSNGIKSSSLNQRHFTANMMLTANDIEKQALYYLNAPNKNPLFAYSWGRLFRSDIIKKNNITFKINLYTFEDVTFNFEYLSHCKTIFYIHSALYNHTIHDGFQSATMTIGHQPQRLYDFTDAVYTINQYLKQRNPKRDFSAEIGHAITTLTIIQTIRMCGQLNFSTFWPIYKAIKTFVSRSEIHSCFNLYRPAKGNSILLPFLLKHGLVFAGMILCMYKSSKRYKKVTK